MRTVPIGPFLRVSCACVVDEEVPHFTCDGGEEMRPVLPAHVFGAEQPHVHLVHQAGGPQGVIGTLVPQVAGGDAPQLWVDQRDQLIPRVLVATAQLAEKRRDVARSRHGHSRQDRGRVLRSSIRER